MTMYKYVLTALEELSGQCHDTKTVSEASGLLSYLKQPEFLVAFVISEHMLGYTKQLSLKLQGELAVHSVDYHKL